MSQASPDVVNQSDVEEDIVSPPASPTNDDDPPVSRASPDVASGMGADDEENVVSPTNDDDLPKSETEAIMRGPSGLIIDDFPVDEDVWTRNLASAQRFTRCLYIDYQRLTSEHFSFE